jgi:electron transfer flavoprotein alpha subunit
VTLFAATRVPSGSPVIVLHPLHAALQPRQNAGWGPTACCAKMSTAWGLSAPTASSALTAAAPSRAGRPNVRPVAQVQRPLHQVPSPAFYIAVVPDMVGGRLSSHDRDVLGLAHVNWQAATARCWPWCSVSIRKVLLQTAGVDRLLMLDHQGYAPEQQVLGLRAVDNQFSAPALAVARQPQGGGELGSALCRAPR